MSSPNILVVEEGVKDPTFSESAFVLRTLPISSTSLHRRLSSLNPMRGQAHTHIQQLEQPRSILITRLSAFTGLHYFVAEEPSGTGVVDGVDK